MTIRVIRDWKNIPNVIIQDDIIKYGWEKALILSNIDKCIDGDGDQVSFDNLHEFFKCIEHSRFYALVGELIKSKDLKISNDS